MSKTSRRPRRAERFERQERNASRAQEYGLARDAGLLWCSNCGDQLPAGRPSMSVELGAGGQVLVSCEACMPALLVVLEEVAADYGAALEAAAVVR